MTSPIKLQVAAKAAMTEKDLTELSARVFDDLRQLTGDGIGVSRATYGDGESAAMDYMVRLAESEGLAVRRDAAANLVIELPGKDPDAPCIVCGSHLDSVPQGGNYDGA